MLKPLSVGLFKSVLGFTLLPLRAPLLLVLLGVSVYLGIHWSLHEAPSHAMHGILGGARQLYWSAECFQAVTVVVICTMPDLLLRQLSAVMAASRVMTLVVSLLLVTVAGLYLLKLSALADVVILAAAVLLARLDLTRIRVVPPPVMAAIGLSTYVMVGVWLGRLWHQSGGLLGL
ncbi:hypothetical protein KBY66_04640 [Synechococcus sp. Tobar12-5m-g]|jgi:hypothetical protein|uniref:hypothetical protein n=1 Tax=unclassified Synechococcus TaxID=2626047 RepID=UPI0020CE909E|nr:MULTISPECIES: hypothetical protein [unclassified Synechococcus]MCP9771914.1 hypothetical protein [Synechococcus sp. Tobar12-5m-g]MCP9872856.1 hypothetical protein [Synechococcus sp. Cruz CV-v-12]